MPQLYVQGAMADFARNRIDFGPFRTTKHTRWRAPRDAFNPTFHLTPALEKQLGEIRAFDQRLAAFDIDDALAHRMRREALVHNAYGTASIEGNPLTFKEVQSVVDLGVAKNADEREILNYVGYLEDMDSITIPRTVEDLLAVHAELFDGVLSDAGKLKETPNFIGDRGSRIVHFIPTMPERVEEELQTALDWLHESDLDPLLKAQLFFHESLGIHAFLDGNGRLGRAMTTLILRKGGFVGAKYALVDFAINSDKSPYYQNLGAVEKPSSDYTPWLAYLTRILHSTWSDTIRGFEVAKRLPTGFNDRQQQIAVWFSRRGHAPAAKLADVQAAFQAVPSRTLQLDLAKLHEAGVVKRTGDRKAARYRFL